MPPLFTINACKSAGCRNLGLPDSPDYVWPDYRTGYPALHCRACGSYPPLFNEVEFRRWASAYIAQYAKEHGHFCPDCYQKTWIRYGRNPGGTQRLQCQYCKKVWTPKQHALNVAETPEQICSIPLLVPFQGANAFQQLYFYSVLTLFAAIFFTFPAISRYFLPERVCITTGKELRRPRVRMAILFTVSPLKNGNFYSAASSMRFSMARRRLNGTRKGQYFARSLRRMVIFGC